MPARSPSLSRSTEPQRCGACGEHAGYRDRRDAGWGFQVDDDQRLFEKLCLDTTLNDDRCAHEQFKRPRLSAGFTR